jgi:hypothetical protein
MAIRFEDQRFPAVIVQVDAVLNRDLPLGRRTVRTKQFPEFRAKFSLPFAAFFRRTAAKLHFERSARGELTDAVMDGRAALQFLGLRNGACQNSVRTAAQEIPS